MKIKKKRRVNITLDMTPMVDIAFLLLIFYMATTQFKPPEKKEVTLPTSHSQVNLPDKGKILVTVTEDDSVFLEYVVKDTTIVDGEPVVIPVFVDESVMASQVGETVQWVRTKKGLLGAMLIVKADRNTKYGTMETIMESLKKNFLRTFQIVTEFESEADI
ncbi:MAG: biopolymer transporter ExbD [candidate division Zixibacteria bacterium]|nr:biopolymer transporter ExbD [candidate division Zixibacteria bacterium]MBU1471235.1 biopolymer transporter ExbD [candidate division Zixibacteria bacterium]MBU2624937.1 biopolymer transporter ExbD [candidate division Zixibacteria bacterium]